MIEADGGGEVAIARLYRPKKLVQRRSSIAESNGLGFADRGSALRIARRL